MEFINGEKNRRSTGRLNKSIHRIYLTLSLVIGIILILCMPIFSEPDGQAHYLTSSVIAGIPNDIGKYGELGPTHGLSNVKNSYQRNEVFKQYYEVQIQKMPSSLMPNTVSIPSILSYEYLGHLIPALGVWIGYHIYPSLGVMELFGRLLSLLFSSVCMFFIIRYVRFGKLLFAAVMLSPTALLSAASLSYDTLSFILVALIVAFTINFTTEKIFIAKKLWIMLLISLLSYFALKTNFLIVLLLFPLAIVTKYLSQFRVVINKKQIIYVIIGGGVLSFVLGEMITRQYDGLFYILKRFAVNIFYNFIPANGGATPFPQVFSAPVLNNVPAYITGLWAVGIAIVLLGEKKFIENKLIALGSLTIFILSIFVIYFGFMSQNYYSTAKLISLGQVGGLWGRYFTPLIFILPLFFGWEKIKIKVFSEKTIVIGTVILIIVSNFLLIFDTLFSIYYV